jgi:tRNA (adenine37-N6)-methyltransferase
MEKSFQVIAIGEITTIDDRTVIKLENEYLPGLTHIEGFSHLQVVWWGHLTDDAQSRKTLIADRLFRKAPDKVGIFSTRSPVRPNPILVSTIFVEEIDAVKGIIYTPFIDAEPGTPVLDIKPYFPMERVKNCKVPAWFEHWPKWAEDGVRFNWLDEIYFEQ